MAPSCPNSTLRLLTSILLIGNTVHAAALPQPQVLDTRSPIADPESGKAENYAVTLDSKPDPKNFFKDLGDFLGQYDGIDILRAMFGGSKSKDRSFTTTVTIYPTPIPASSGDRGGMTIYVTPGPITSTSVGGISNTSVPVTISSSSRITRVVTVTSTRTITSTPGTWFDVVYPNTSSSSRRISTRSPTPATTTEPMFHILPWFPPASSSNDTGRFSALDVSDPYILTPPTTSATSTRPWILTNPLRPSDVPPKWPNVSTEDIATTTSSTRPWISTNPLRPTTSINDNFTAEKFNATTTRLRSTSVIYMYETLSPSPYSILGVADSSTSTGTEVLSLSLPMVPPLHPNSTMTSEPKTPPPTPLSSLESELETTTLPIFLPLPTPPSLNVSTVNADFSTLAAFRRICSDPKVKTITLPLLNRFYGPNAYPSLFPFPGCSEEPTSRQALQAPGLLNCSLLGVEVQNCQRNGRRVLLSVKGDRVEDVAGNIDFGAPDVPSQPFGPYFGQPDESEETEPAPEPHFGSNEPPEPAWTFNTSKEITALPLTLRRPYPNLFNEKHPPTAFALTLFSLFGEGHTERADLRPLGPDTPSSASPDGIQWLNRPLGEEVVLDGFDVQVPGEWKGTYQAGKFDQFVKRLRELTDDAWKESGGKKGGSGDLGRDGKGIVVLGWT